MTCIREEMVIKRESLWLLNEGYSGYCNQELGTSWAGAWRIKKKWHRAECVALCVLSVVFIFWGEGERDCGREELTNNIQCNATIQTGGQNTEGCTNNLGIQM